MCGLAGIVSLDGHADLRVSIERMTEILVHRGPDDTGLLIEDKVALGFRRLSILDLEATGHQPMTSTDGSYTIVFNGEIFNYVELRKELEAKGHKFRSTGDTEVLLNAYREWGEECLPKLNGMWAFLLYDRRRNIVFGSRDRFGVKPLFMHRSKGQVLFASEIKAIRASGLYSTDFDWGTIADFLVRQKLDETDRTFFAGIEQVPPGTAFRLDFAGQFSVRRFWSLDGLTPREIEDPIEEYGALFEDAVRIRMRSDVPVAVFLSGGIDSTSILCSLARNRETLPPERRERLRAFAFMDPRFDETRFINDTIQQTGAELERVEYSSQDIWTDLPKVLWHHDQPVHSTTALIGFRLSRVAAARGIKVILNGQGADETAAGYTSYFDAYWQTILMSMGPSALFRELQRHAQLWGGSPVNRFLRVLRFAITGQSYRLRSYQRLRSHLAWKKQRRHPWLTSEFISHLEPAERRSNHAADLNTELKRAVEKSPLPLYLRVEDRNSMAHSVEVRLPFLDYRLVSLLFSLPGDLKMSGGFNKNIIRQSMRGRIPDSVHRRHDKMGFPSPAGAWISELESPIQDVLDSQSSKEIGIFDVAAIKRRFAEHCAGHLEIGREMFDIVQFLIWFQMTKESGDSAIAGIARQH